MYTVLIIVLLALAAWILYRGGQRRSIQQIVLGVLIGIGSVFLFWFLDFWGNCYGSNRWGLKAGSGR